MTATFDHQAEAIAALPHELGCFEWYAEELQERAAAAGVDIEGGHEDLFQGLMVIDWFHQEMVKGRAACHCVNPPADESE